MNEEPAPESPNINSHKQTKTHGNRAPLPSRIWVQPSSFVVTPTFKMWSVDVLLQNTSLATMMNQSETGWYKGGFFKTKKNGGGCGDGGLWLPAKPLLCSPGSTGPDWNFKPRGGKKNAWVGGRGRVPTLFTLHPSLPEHFYLTEPSWKHTVFSLVFMVLINAWVTGASHSPEILEFCPGALIKLNRMDTGAALALACPFCCLIWINICLLTPDTLWPQPLRASSSIPRRGVGVGRKRRAEEWCHLAQSTLTVEKSSSSHLQLNFSVLWPKYYISNGALLLTEKSLHSIQDLPHSGLYLLFHK